MLVNLGLRGNRIYSSQLKTIEAGLVNQAGAMSCCNFLS